jgi:3-carboxy-cis,cis-muconate cycloisomerase
VRPSSSRSELFAAIEARGGTAAATSDRAWLQAMLDFEAGLARTQARAGVISADEAEAIAQACDAERFDIAEIGAAAAEIGNPAGPLVKALREIGPAHKGATSQDVLDTAAMLVAKRALAPLLEDLQAGADAAARLAAEHRDTVMAGRTLLQQAEPITFGLKAAGWMRGLDRAASRLRGFRPAVQLGGAAGTGDPQMRSALAAELGLHDPLLSWHTERTAIGELAASLAIAAGAAGKVARDITLLAQTEVREVREAVSGGSTAMPHKQNPVAAIAALACAKQAPGLASTLLASMVQEHERAAGAWHAEFKPLSDLLTLTGSAAAWLRTSLEGLQVDPERMRANLTRPGSPGASGELVDRALAAHRTEVPT